MVFINSKKSKTLDYKEYENELGVMYHLLLDKIDEDGVKYVSESNYPKYASVEGKPIFFNWDQEFRLAIDYTIIYPKIYIKESVEYTDKHQCISRSYIQ